MEAHMVAAAVALAQVGLHLLVMVLQVQLELFGEQL
jgi:hypothetical protein